MEASARVLPDCSASPLHHGLDLFQDEPSCLVVALHPGFISGVQPWETFWVFIGAQWLGAGPAIAEVQWYPSSPGLG